MYTLRHDLWLILLFCWNVSTHLHVCPPFQHFLAIKALWESCFPPFFYRPTFTCGVVRGECLKLKLYLYDSISLIYFIQIFRSVYSGSTTRWDGKNWRGAHVWIVVVAVRISIKWESKNLSIENNREAHENLKFPCTLFNTRNSIVLRLIRPILTKLWRESDQLMAVMFQPHRLQEVERYFTKFRKWSNKRIDTSIRQH